jgi:uncharacterized membrane protein YgcG
MIGEEACCKFLMNQTINHARKPLLSTQVLTIDHFSTISESENQLNTKQLQTLAQQKPKAIAYLTDTGH